MLIIDFTTPEWVKNLILSLHPIKNMEKHFALPSTDPVKFVMEFEKTEDINYQKVELDEKNVTGRKIKNEFDENSERSTTLQAAEVNYEQIIGKNKPSESIVITKEELLEIFFITLCTDINSNINRENTNQQVILDNEILFNQLNNNYACSYEDRSLDYNSNLCNNEVSLLSEENRSIEIY